MPTESSWDAKLLSALTDEWVSAEALAARFHAKPFTVQARLKDLLRRNLVERKIVKHPTKIYAGRPIQQAQFRRTQLGRTP
jgi:predicted transcriptional regulator